METFLKIWAIVGPLLAAGASAIWSRRMQLQDREFDRDRAEKERENTVSDRALDFKRSIQTEHHKELKAALADFMSAVHEYVICVSRWVSHPSDAADDAASESRKRLNQSYGLVVLLGDAHTSDAATAVVNIAVSLPSSTRDGKFDEPAINTFRTAKAAFVQNARNCLSEQREPSSSFKPKVHDSQ